MNKKTAGFLLLLAVFFGLVFSGCKKANTAGEGIALDKDTSYAIGMYLASQFALPPDVHYDYKSFGEGFEAFTEAQGDPNKQTRFSMEEAYTKIQAAFEQISAQENAKTQEQGVKNLEEGINFLAENGRKSGIITTSSGLQYEVISSGSGANPTAYDTVSVQYEGTLLDGTVFDSSYDRGEPAVFPLNGVIPGWTEGIQLMKVGSTYRFFIPSDLAYGAQGGGPIPPNSVLIFKVELLSIIE